MSNNEYYNPNGLLLDWSPRREALEFFRLIKIGRFSFDEIVRSIPMSDAERKELIRQKIAMPGVINKLFDMRKETLYLLREMTKKESRA